MDAKDEEIEELIETCDKMDFTEIKSTKEIKPTFEVINEILEPLNETEIFFENPGLKINKTLKYKLQIIVPNNKINTEDQNLIKDINFFQKKYEENAVESNKTIDNVKNNFIDLSKSVKSLIELIEKVKNEFFETIKQMVNPIINEIKNIEKFDTKKFDPVTLQTFQNKKKILAKKIKTYDSKLTKIIKDLKEVFKKINTNIQKYLEIMNNLDKPINLMIEEIEKIFDKFEEKSKIFIDIIVNSPDQRDKAFENFNEIKALNNLIMDSIKQYESQLSLKEKELKAKKTECSNDFDKIIESNKESSKKLNNLLKEAKDVQNKLNELLEFCSLPKIKNVIKEYKGLQLEQIKKKVIENTDNIIEANKKIEVDVSKLKKYIKEKDEQINKLITLELVFIMDITGSMTNYLNFAKTKIISIIDLITKNSTVQVSLGFVGYRDYLDSDCKYLIYPELTKDVKKVKEFISSAVTDGGGDCEDMVGGLNSALNYKWEGRSRFALLIADVPCHGIQFHEVPNFDRFPDGDTEYNIIDIIKQFASKNINLVCLNLTDLTIKLYNNFVDYYKQGKKSNNTADIYVGYLGDETTKLADLIVTNAKKFYEKRHETEPEL